MYLPPRNTNIRVKGQAAPIDCTELTTENRFPSVQSKCFVNGGTDKAMEVDAMSEETSSEVDMDIDEEINIPPMLKFALHKPSTRRQQQSQQANSRNTLLLGDSTSFIPG